MSLSHRGAAARPGGLERAGEPSAASPPAQRLQTSRWRDPRLWLGAILVVVSVLTGATLFAAADDTIAVWAVDGDLSAGMPITAADVHIVSVHFADEADAEPYLTAGEEFPSGATLVRDVAPGELLASAAITTRGGSEPDQLPLGVPPAGLPAGLQVGDHVDVWAVPAEEAARSRVARVLAGVTVFAVGDAGPGGLEAQREILVGLPADTDVSDVLAGLRKADVVLVRVGD